VQHSAAPLLTLEEVERQHILNVLEAVDGDRRLAAETLGIGVSTLYAFLAKLKGHEPATAGLPRGKALPH
jgi:transcriptional regulator with PAS, ATPase and Fis domain